MSIATVTRRSAATGLAVSFACICAPSLAAGESYCCQADPMCQGKVNTISVFVLLSNWGDDPRVADLNGDGVVDGWDLGYQLGHWGPCSKDLPFPTSAPLPLEIDEVTPPEATALGLRTFDLFLAFDEPTDRLLNLFDANLGCAEPPCFVHATEGDIEPQVFPFHSLLIEAADITWDTFLTFGATVGEQTSAAHDPNLDIAAFLDGTSLGPDAGWFVLPTSGESLAGTYDGLRIRIARLTIPEGKLVTGALTAMWQRADSTLHLSTIDVEISTRVTSSADLNGDGYVDGADLGILLSNWGNPGVGDINGDGVVDGVDLGILLTQWE